MSSERARASSRRAVAGAALALACGSAGATARAQDAPPAQQQPASGAAASGEPGAATVDARAHFDRGVALFEHRDYDGALAEFLRAQSLSGRATIWFNIGATWHALHRYPEAIDALERYLRETAGAVTPATARQRADAERSLREILALIAHVRITARPAGATVLLDGRPAALGEALAIGPGEHRVEVTLEGHRTARETFTIASGETRELALALEPVAAAGPPNGGGAVAPRAPRARLAVAGVPHDAVVVIAGATQPASAPLEVPPGRYDLAVRAPGMRPWRGRLWLADGPPRTLRVNLVASDAGLRPAWFWGTLAASVALGATALGVGIGAIATNAEFRGLTMSDARLDELEARGRALAITADVLGVTAIAGGVLTLFLLTRTEFNPRASTAVLAAVAPAPGGGAVASAGARF